MDIRPKPPDKIEKNDLVIEIEDGLIVSVSGRGEDYSNLKRRSIRISKHKKSAGELPHR